MTATQTPTLSELQHEACMIARMIEGFDVLNDASGVIYNSENIVERRAANAMRPMIEAAIKAAWELTNRIEVFEDALRKAAREAEGSA